MFVRTERCTVPISFQNSEMMESSRKRCRRAMLLPAVITLVVVSQIAAVAKGFVPQQNLNRMSFMTAKDNKLQRFSTLRQDSVNHNGGGSRFGVRRRVRAVLEKAKKRTGISNVNSSSAEVTALPSVGSSTPNVAFRLTSSTGPATYLGTDTSRQSTTSMSSTLALNGFDISMNSLDSVSSAPKAMEQQQNNLSQLMLSERNDNQEKEAASDLPFALPRLTSEQEVRLAKGERVEQQSTMSREGSGFVVMDIPAPDYVIWEALLDFEAYPQNIGTVRSMRMFTSEHLKQSYIAEKPIPPGRETRLYGKGSITRAQFVLSKFSLNIAAIHKYTPHPDGHYMEFSLDKANKNIVLRDAKGIWHTQSIQGNDGQQYTRLWLLCELKVSPLLPQFIVDYAARKAMPRATNWVMPTVERLRKEFKLDEDTSSFV